MIRLLSIFSIALLTLSSVAFAQNTDLPKLPEPIKNLASEGAQVRYLGRDHGLDAWVTVKNGQEQYFYVMPDQEAFIMGVLFDKSGKLVTVDQVKRLQDQGDQLIDTLSDEEFAGLKKNAGDKDAFEFKTPSEQLFSDIENSNWVGLGSSNAPIMYSFVDPQCPHCHKLIQDMRASYIDNGKVQMRIVPVGFKEETRKQSAFLLAAPNPQERWFAHMDGDTEALPAKEDISDQGVQRNLSIMQSWKFSVTPLIVYRNVNGIVKIIRGGPKDMNAVMSDLGVQ